MYRLLSIALCSVAGLAQQFVGEVLVREESGALRPAPGVRVFWQHGTEGAVTDPHGRFRLQWNGADTLRVRSVAYGTLDTLLLEPPRDTLRLVLAGAYALPEQKVEATPPVISAAPVKTEVVTMRQLEQSACCTLAESFEKSPGIEAFSADAATGIQQVQLLGMHGKYTQLLLEAVPVPIGVTSPYQWELIPGQLLQEISVSKGAASALFGASGITGVMSVKLRQGEQAPRLFANTYTNTNGRVELNGLGGRSSAESALLGYLHARWQPWLDRDRDGFAETPAVRHLLLMGRVFHQDTWERQLLGSAVLGDYRAGSLEQGDSAYPVTVQIRQAWALGKASRELTDAVQLGFQGLLQGGELRTRLGGRHYEGQELAALARALLRIGQENETPVRAMLVASLLWQHRREHLRDSLTYELAAPVPLLPGLSAELMWDPFPSVKLIAGVSGELWGRVLRLSPRVNLCVEPSDWVLLRLGGGTGYRRPVLAELLPALANSRRLELVLPGLESAWNAGASLTLHLPVLGSFWTLDAEYFRTEFRQQWVEDMDWGARRLRVEMLPAKADHVLLLLDGAIAPLEFRLAYRWWNSRAPTGGRWQPRALIAPHRVLWTLNLPLAENTWQMSTTLVWTSSGRIPSTADNPDSLRWGERFPARLRVNAQLLRRFGALELYAGVENLTNALQSPAILARPGSPYFDASMVWGVLEPRFLYLGMRWSR
jgi:outer membrane receptor for ferrienterochelin and colicins